MGFLFIVQVFTVFGTWGVYFFFFFVSFQRREQTHSLKANFLLFIFFARDVRGGE